MAQRQHQSGPDGAEKRSAEPRTVAGRSRARPLEPRLVGGDGDESRLVTFLAVDLAEASAALERLGEGRVAASRTAYLSLLRSAVAAHTGRELLQHEDQLLVAFDSPSDAAACAVVVQRAAARHSRSRSDRLDIRMGIQLGEAVEPSAVSEHGQVMARPALQARQLCEAALGGQVLVSFLVSTLARSATAYTFERAGLLDVEGTDDPLPTFELRHETVSSERPPLPVGLAARPTGRCSFVGRAAELVRLREIWATAAAGERRLAFLSGEPGIGKSRLAAEFAAEAHTDGGVVLFGRSFEESIIPYQPFVEALRQYVADCDPADLEAQLGGDPSPLVTIVPELATGLPTHMAEGHSEGERYRLFDSVAALLSTISLTSPVLVALDDLQWADPATLLLLKHIVLDPRPASLLILGLYRDTEVDAAHPLASLQADVERDFVIERVSLAGLEAPAVASMLDEMIGWSPPVAVARGLRSDTEGNPFFLQEVIHQLDESGVASDRERMARGDLLTGELGVPTRVRDFMARRMQHLSSDALETLGTAAVIGTEFTLDILGTVLSMELDDLIGHLDEALEANLLMEVPSRAGAYAFAHALFQQALHERHSSTRRAMLHVRVAEAIESLRPDDPATLSDLARHYALATSKYAEKVVRYASAAGDRSLAGLAYEDAVEEYQRALDALSLAAADELTEADLLVRLGEAKTRAGEEGWQQVFVAAAEHCVGEGSSATLARAALGYGGNANAGGVFDLFMRVDETLVGLLERALSACPKGDGVDRARLLGRLATALYWSDDKRRVLGLSQEALDIARRLGDPATLAVALDSRHAALWGPDHIAEGRAAAEEALLIGRALDDRDVLTHAYTWLISDSLETDAIEVTDEYLAAFSRLADELHQAYHLGHAGSLQAMRAQLDGRFDDAAQASIGTLAHGEGAYVVLAQQTHLAQMAALQIDLGDVDAELMAGLAHGVELLPPRSVFRALLALAYATVGRDDEAATELAVFTRHGLADIPRDCAWAATLGMLTQVVSMLGAVEHARILYDLLLPVADRCSVMGGGFQHFGPFSRLLGMLATMNGEPDRALSHLDQALEQSRNLGSPPLVARTQTEMARALLAREEDDDVERARSLLEDAQNAAIELGMTRLARDVTGLVARATLAFDLAHRKGHGS